MDFTLSSYTGRLVLNPSDIILQLEHTKTSRNYQQTFYDFHEFAQMGGIEFISRLLSVVFWEKCPLEHLRYMGYMALLPAMGFFLIYGMGWRKTGAEVFGYRIWWNELRPIHGALWLLFAVMAIQRWPHTWYILFADVALGAGAYARQFQKS